jgi:hypothetical protein
MVSATSVADYKVNFSSSSLNKASFGVLSPVVPVLVPFDETGTYGNIALIGSNGITEASITSNAISYNGSYPVNSLFDGYHSSTQINTSSTGRIGVGFFHSISGTNTNRYFSVDLGREASISGFRVLSYAPRYTIHFPKDVRIESSVDGTDGSFTLEESFTLSKVPDSGVIPMSTPFTSRYFRFHVENSYNPYFLRFGQIEVFQTQP